jgi:hypothetical protein
MRGALNETRIAATAHRRRDCSIGASLSSSGGKAIRSYESIFSIIRASFPERFA